LVGAGRGAARADDAQGVLTQNHVSPTLPSERQGERERKREREREREMRNTHASNSCPRPPLCKLSASQRGPISLFGQLLYVVRLKLERGDAEAIPAFVSISFYST